MPELDPRDARIAELEAKVAWLMERVAKLEAENAEVVRLRAENQELRAQLGRNSQNLSKNRLITVERQVWREVVDTPKGGRGRSVPMTMKLGVALGTVRHLRGARLLLQDDGSSLSAKVLRGWMKSAQRLAGLKATGNFHILRHTFCSHLAMRGAPAKVIQELAGHTHLSTTMRYMHLSPGHKEQAIRLLDLPPEQSDDASRGGGVEAELRQEETPGRNRGLDGAGKGI